MSETAVPAEVIVGVDTHKHVHAAVAISALGARLDAKTVPVGGEGYRDLEAWARSLGPVRAFGVEDRLVWCRPVPLPARARPHRAGGQPPRPSAAAPEG